MPTRGKPERREERSQGHRKRSISPMPSGNRRRGRIGELPGTLACRGMLLSPKESGQSLNCLGGEREQEPPSSKMKSKDGRKHRRGRERRRERPNRPQYHDRSRPDAAWSAATVGARGKESARGLAAILGVEASARAARDEEEWPLLRGRSQERGRNESSRAPRGMRARRVERESELA